jgi:hypothetical protein
MIQTFSTAADLAAHIAASEVIVGLILGGFFGLLAVCVRLGFTQGAA